MKLRQVYEISSKRLNVLMKRQNFDVEKLNFHNMLKFQFKAESSQYISVFVASLTYLLKNIRHVQ